MAIILPEWVARIVNLHLALAFQVAVIVAMVVVAVPFVYPVVVD